MTKTVFEQVCGELVDGDKVQNIQLRLTICELLGQGLTPVNRAITNIKLAEGCAVQDGSYTLRYCWGGGQEEQCVRIRHGMLISG